MSRPYVRKAPPQRSVRVCGACLGERYTVEEDYDDIGVRRFSVPCEGCNGCGEVVDCDRCDEPTPLTEAESLGYICANCVERLQNADAEAEIARIRRASSW